MLASSQVDSFLFRLRRLAPLDFVRLLVLGAVLLYIPLSAYGFYSIHSRILIILLLAGFLAFAMYDPVSSLCVLFLASILCGNHPGGTYLELFDFLLLNWVMVSEFQTRKSGIFSFAGGFEWLFFFSCIISLFANRFLIKDIFSHVANPYFILTANETQAFYAVKMLIMTFTCIVAALIVYRLYRQRGDQVLETIARSIFIASCIAIAAGILEVHSGNFAQWLSRMRFFIDKDFGDSEPHTILPFLHWLQGTTAAKGLFWNRGWFGIYLIAALPFALYFLHIHAIKSGNLWKHLSAVLYLIIFFYTLLLIGARGAFLGFVGCILFYFTGLALQGRIPRFLHAIPYAVLLFAVLFPWTAFVVRLQPALGLRTGFFKAGFEIGFPHPVFGGGAEVFGWNNISYLAGTPDYSALHSPHNQLLQIFSGQGLVGVTCYLALLVFVIRSLNRSSASNANYLPLMSGLIAFLIYSSFQEWFYLRSVQLLWWLLLVFCFLTAEKKDVPNAPLRIRRWVWIVPLIFLCAAPIAGALQKPPKNFGFSPSTASVQSLRWRWVVGNEAWSELPADTGAVRLQLRNFRPDPYFVTVEIPPVYKTTVPFNRNVGWKILDIDLPEGKDPRLLKISCDRIWSGMDFNRADNRKLCIATHLKLIAASK